MRYSKSFDRDFNWYLSVRHQFNFDGKEAYYDKKGSDLIVYDKNGVDGKKSFLFMG